MGRRRARVTDPRIEDRDGCGYEPAGVRSPERQAIHDRFVEGIRKGQGRPVPDAPRFGPAVRIKDGLDNPLSRAEVTGIRQGSCHPKTWPVLPHPISVVAIKELSERGASGLAAVAGSRWSRQGWARVLR